MSTVEEIKAAVEKLSFEEKAEFARWFHGWKDDAWDRQMARDIATGKLAKLLADTDADVDAGRLRELP